MMAGTQRGGGFAMNRELAIEAGRKGGKISRRSLKRDRTLKCPYCPTMLGTNASRNNHVSKFHYDIIN